MTPLQTLLAEFRELAQNKRDLGDKFERLLANFLVNDPLYADKYDKENVWLWSEWGDRWGSDNGIDVVAKDVNTGEYCAIQCKFFDPASQLEKGDIDSFFTESGKRFATLDGEKAFSSRLIVCSGQEISDTAIGCFACLSAICFS